MPYWKVMQDSAYAQSGSMDWPGNGLVCACQPGATGACILRQSWGHPLLPLLQLRGQLQGVSLRLLPGTPHRHSPGAFLHLSTPTFHSAASCSHEGEEPPLGSSAFTSLGCMRVFRPTGWTLTNERQRLKATFFSLGQIVWRCIASSRLSEAVLCDPALTFYNTVGIWKHFPSGLFSLLLCSTPFSLMSTSLDRIPLNYIF